MDGKLIDARHGWHSGESCNQLHTSTGYSIAGL